MGKNTTIRPKVPQKAWQKEGKEASDEIEIIRNEAVLRSEDRKNVFLRILSNSASNDVQSLRYIIYSMGSIVGSMIPILVYTLIPVHNVILDPYYWFEFPLQTAISLVPCYVGVILFKSSYYINMNCLRAHLTFHKIVLVTVVLYIAIHAIAYLAWTQLAQYQNPIPFTGYGCYYVVNIFALAMVWLSFPSHWRREKIINERLKSLMIAVVLNQFLPTAYFVIVRLMLICPREYQWIVSFALPLFRQLLSWITLRYVIKAADGDENGAEIFCSYAVGSVHAMFLVYTLGSIATFGTHVVMLATDFAINIFICCRIIYVKHKKPEDTETITGLLQTLIVNEMVEFMIPLACVGCLFISYFGPNAELIGNIGNDYWQYSKMENLEHALKYALTFFLTDLGSLIASLALLWIFCHLNSFRAFIAIQKEFGFAFMVQMASLLNSVSK